MFAWLFAGLFAGCLLDCVLDCLLERKLWGKCFQVLIQCETCEYRYLTNWNLEKHLGLEHGARFIQWNIIFSLFTSFNVVNVVRRILSLTVVMAQGYILKLPGAEPSHQVCTWKFWIFSYWWMFGQWFLTWIPYSPLPKFVIVVVVVPLAKASGTAVRGSPGSTAQKELVSILESEINLHFYFFEVVFIFYFFEVVFIFDFFRLSSFNFIEVDFIFDLYRLCPFFIFKSS